MPNLSLHVIGYPLRYYPIHELYVTRMKNIQTFASYNREEIIDFLAPYEVFSLRSKDNDQIYQVKFWLPPNWLIILCLLLPLIMLWTLPVLQDSRIFFTISCFVIIPFFIYGFHKIFRIPLKSKMTRFIYEKGIGIFTIPHLQLQIARSEIIEFVVISGWYKRTKNTAGNMSINELSIVFQDKEGIRRVPLFLSVNKKRAMKIAKKLSEYTGKENYYKKV